MGQKGHRASSKPGPEDTLLALCTLAITVGRTGRCSQEGDERHSEQGHLAEQSHLAEQRQDSPSLQAREK